MADSSRVKIVVVVVVLAVVVVVIGLGLSLGLYFGLRDDGDDESSSTGGTGDRVVSTSGEYGKAAVASDAEPCSKVGAQILASGGSAVDGAIATILCLGVVNCHSTGLGGGGFMVVHQNEYPDSPVVIDFREVAPLDAYRDMYEEDDDSSLNGKSSCIATEHIAGRL